MRKQDKTILWVIFLLLSGFLLLILLLGIYNSLSSVGIKIDSGNLIFIFGISVLLVFWAFISNKLKIIKLNKYFIIALVISWIVLFIGLTVFARNYQPEIPFSINPHISPDSNLSDLPRLNCYSISNKNYFAKWDNLVCSINSSLTYSDFKLKNVIIIKHLLNKTQSEPIITGCLEKDECSFILYLEDNALGYTINTEYFNNSSKDLQKITPAYYYFPISNLREGTNVEDLEQNKFTLFLTIITASFLSVWAVVYYAKKILK